MIMQLSSVDAPDAAIQTLTTYHKLMGQMANRFPFRKFGSSGLLSFFAKEKTVAVMVPFSWSSAFRSDFYCVEHSISFEQASVLFNIGLQISCFIDLLHMRIFRRVSQRMRH